MLLELLEDDTHARSRSDRKRLRIAARFIHNNRVQRGDGGNTDGAGQAHAGWDDEALMNEVAGFVDTLGGEGTPLIAVSAPVAWATASHRSLTSAKHYLANTMDLIHRFPRLHRRVEDLTVRAWTAFDLCEATRDLSFDCARWIDDHLAAGGRYGQKAVHTAIKTAVAKFHPELLRNSGDLDRDDWDVTVDHNPHGSPTGGNGTSVLEAVGDSMDLSRFLDAVNDEAATAGRLGDTDTLGQRRAKALGVLADRQATLDLADLIHPETGRVVHRRRSYGKIRLFIHLTKTDLDAFLAGDTTRHGNAGRLGPQPLARIADWVRAYGPDAHIQPVVDTTWSWAVDQHDPPKTMREQVIQRDRHCVFPNCRRDSRHVDLDHIVPFDENGPPGQTNPENLAPLCRRHHLVKTHYGWTYVRNRDGTYTWTNPLGRTWLVTPLGHFDAHPFHPRQH